MFTPETLPGPHFQPSDKGQKHDQNTHIIYFEDSLAGEFGGNVLGMSRGKRRFALQAKRDGIPTRVAAARRCPLLLNVNTPCTHQPGTGFKTALGATIAGIRARLYRTCFESMRDFVTSKAKQTIPAYGCRVAMKTATQITDSTVPAKSKRLQPGFFS